MPARLAKSLQSIVPRFLLSGLGGLCFGVGIVMNVQADLGQGPWVAFHYGLTLHTPLTMGQANVGMSVVMMLVSIGLRVPPGLGTLFSVAVVGGSIDAFLETGLVPKMTGLVDGYVMLLAGVLVMTLGTALMVKARLGTGPRDSFMLGLTSLTGLRVGFVKGGVEGMALVLGFLMAAPVSHGTLVYVVTIGPAVELWFRVFGLRAPRRQTTTQEGEIKAS